MAIPKGYDPLIQRLVMPGATLVQRTLPEIKGQAVAMIDRAIGAKMLAGFTLPDGTKIDTSVATRATIHQCIDLIERGLKADPFTYDGPNGPVSTTNAMLLAEAKLIADYLQGLINDGVAAKDKVNAVTDPSQTGIDAIRAIIQSVS